MKDEIAKLKKLDDNRLIDVVKNYRQYGYNEELRAIAILLLEDRGITIEELAMSGNFSNRTYDYAESIYKSYRSSSIVAFILYGMMILITFRVFPFFTAEGPLGSAAIFLTIGVILFYFIFLIKSFLSQSQFYKAIGHNYGVDGALLYLLLGMPFYFFMFIYFRSQMKEKMKEIR